MGRLDAATVLSAEKAAGSHVPYSHHVTPEILATRRGEYLSVWRLGGRSHETAAASELAGWVTDLNNAMKGVATAGVAFWSHVIRRRVDEFPSSGVEGYFCRRLDERYAASLRAAGSS